MRAPRPRPPSAGVRRLVINADDLGFTPAVNRGIIEAHRAGAVSSASMMVNAPGFADALRLVGIAPSLRIGLHLNLVQGRPLAQVPSLTDPLTGAFLSLGRLATRALAGRVDPDDVRAETTAQLAALRAAGIRPTHLDSHRHAHALPGIWSPVVGAALAAGVDVIRRPWEPLSLHPLDLRACAKRLVLGASLRLAPAWRVRSPDHFIGLSLQGGRDVLPRLLRALDALAPGATELMVHAGRTDAELEALDSYVRPRERELEALTSAPLRERLLRGDIELIHFGQV